MALSADDMERMERHLSMFPDVDHTLQHPNQKTRLQFYDELKRQLYEAEEAGDHKSIQEIKEKLDKLKEYHLYVPTHDLNVPLRARIPHRYSSFWGSKRSVKVAPLPLEEEWKRTPVRNSSNLSQIHKTFPIGGKNRRRKTRRPRRRSAMRR
jgi:hypothetical protein